MRGLNNIMTNQEKIDEINKRLDSNVKLTYNMLEMTVVFGYLEELIEKGFLTGQGDYKITIKGKDLFALCQEFDIKPSDDIIKGVCLNLVGMGNIPKYQLESFCHLFQLYRDHKDWTVEELTAANEEYKNNHEN